MELHIDTKPDINEVDLVELSLTTQQYEALSIKDYYEYLNLDSEEREQYRYFMGFVTHTAELRVTSNKEIKLYQEKCDTIQLKTVAQLLDFIPHKGQQPIFYTYDEQKDIKNNLVLVLGRRAQTLDSVIKSPNGNITFRDVKVNDTIFDPDGGLQTVKAVHDIYQGDVYDVQVGNKTCKVDSEHLFTVYDHHNKERVLDINYIKDYYKKPRKNSHYNPEGVTEYQLSPVAHEYKFRIKNIEPLEYHEAQLPIDPYLLGLLLGDGTIAKAIQLGMQDKDAIERGLARQGLTEYNIIEAKEGYYTVSLGRYLLPALKALGLYGTYSNSKFIPSMYKTASKEQRLELLRGLMDTDGYVYSSKNLSGLEYTTVSEQLSKDVEELVYSLGGDCTTSSRYPKFRHKGELRTGQLSYRMYIRIKLNPFYIKRKADKFVEPKALFNFIKDIKQLPSEPVRCISVSSKSECYVTDNFIRTHNTGKSASTSIIAVKELLIPFSSTILLTPTFNNAKIIFNETLKHVQALGLEIKSINKGSFRFELKNGARFSANSASNIESALGTANSLLLCDESQSIPNLEEIMNQMLVPTLLDYGTRPSGILYGRQIYLGTPRGTESYLYDLFCKQDEHSNWKSFSAPSHSNPILPQTYFEQMRLDLGDMLYSQEILAQFVGSDSNVFYAFGEHNTYEPNSIKFSKYTDVIVGIDVGFRDSTAGVFVYRDPRGNYYIDKAYSENMKATSVHVANLKALDSEMIGTTDLRYMDPAAAQLICDYIQDYDYQVYPAKNAVQESIKYLNQLFTPTGANQKPRLYINSELKELIRQVTRVRWKDTANKTAKEPFSKDPKGTHWDLIAALRYAIYSDQHNISASTIITS